jgi:predicted transcriptional regulator
MKQERIRLKVSQAELARLSGVSRVRINAAEMGDIHLRAEEMARIQRALRGEAHRLMTAAAATLGWQLSMQQAEEVRP